MSPSYRTSGRAGPLWLMYLSWSWRGRLLNVASAECRWWCVCLSTVEMVDFTSHTLYYSGRGFREEGQGRF